MYLSMPDFQFKEMSEMHSGKKTATSTNCVGIIGCQHVDTQKPIHISHPA